MHHFFKRLTYIFFSVLLIIFFTDCKSKSKASSSNAPKINPPVVVDIIIAEKESISDTIEANGTVIANEYVELRPEVSGRLIFLHLPEGKLITKGTVVARVNDADLLAQISRSNVQLDLAQKTVDRLKQLLDVNGLNQADYDAALNQVNTLKADIVYTRALVDKTVVRTPFNGVAGLRQVSPGAYVTPATIIATLQQTSEVKVDFTLPEMYGDAIKTGTLVEVEVDAVTKEKGRAMIIATEPGANTDTRNLKVRALLKGAHANPGAFVKVYIDAGKGRASIKVPANCIIPDDRNNQVILIKKGKASFVNVQTGIRESNTVEVTNGIDVGDSIVVTGVLFARPNGALKVRQVKKLSGLTDSAGIK
ncbi:MAG: efflux RND transporter periplasmic adaptor subunit [Ferruginibacter sp.]|nr:efflux RND transporter periplasmic adaptor subunit [Ferruginibacter sp.]